MMLVSAFGTASPYGFWGFSAVRQVIQVLYGDHHHIHCDTADRLRTSWDAARDGRPVVFTSDCPDCEISSLFAEFNAPIFVFLDEIEDSVAFAMAMHRMDAYQGIRFAVQRYCALSALVQTPKAICFTAREFDKDVRDLVYVLFQLIAAPPSQEQIDQAISGIVRYYRPDVFTTVGEQVRQIGAEARETHGWELPQVSGGSSQLISELAFAYHPILQRKQLVALKWPRDLFINSANNEPQSNVTPINEAINLLGPARRLTYGPFLFLPAGTWIATVKFEISECFSSNKMGVDVSINHSGAVTAIGFDLPVQGVFTVDIAFEHKDPNCWIEVRTWLLEGAIEGKLLFHSVSLRRTDPAVKALNAVER